MPTNVAPDEQAVEIASAGDIGAGLNDRLASEEERERRELAVLKTIVEADELPIVNDLIRLNTLERARISRTRFIFALVAQQGRRLAGALSK